MAHRLFLCCSPTLGMRLYRLADNLEAAGCEMHCDPVRGRLAVTVPDALVQNGSLDALLEPYGDLLRREALRPAARAVQQPPQDGLARKGPAQHGPAQHGPAQDPPAQDRPVQDRFVVAWQLPG